MKNACAARAFGMIYEQNYSSNKASTSLPKDFFNSLLGNYGEIQDLTLQTDNNGNFLGMGFVTYREEKSPRVCYEGLNEATLQGISLFIKMNC